MTATPDADEPPMERPLRLMLPDPAATDHIGRLIGARLPPQAICLLTGDLAAGKTTLAKAICAALDIDPRIVISPTYTLTNIYPGRCSVFHVDLYRIEASDELAGMDMDDWINPEGITLIEWPQVAKGLLQGLPTLRLLLSRRGVPDGGGHELIAWADDGTYAPVIQALGEQPGAQAMSPPFPAALWCADADGVARA
jgi:tRNA threonylcarbamoyladenosine biosynthesis protein TsaE